MQYRLLRNNKETGPYTKEQLVQFGFKPYDLVWADGKSASWSYPSEMPEFKAFAPVVEEQPFDRFYKKKDKTVIETVPANDAVKKEKPRIRIRADWKKIDAAIAAIPPLETRKTLAKEAALQTQQPEWQRIYTEWQQQQQPVVKTEVKKAEKPVAAGEKVVVETKFSQSLSDIKEHYIKTVLKDKKKNNFTLLDAKNLWPALIIILLAAGFVLSKKFKHAPLKEEIAQVEGKPAEEKPAGVMSDDKTTDAITEFNNKGDEFDGSIKASDAVNKGAVASQKISAVNNLKEHAAAKTNAVIKHDEIKTAALNKADNNNRKANVVKPEVRAAAATQGSAYAKDDGVKKQQVPVSKPSPDILPKRKIDDYVLVSKAAASQAPTVQDVHLAVKNISGFPIDLAVVEVKYYDANGRYQKGETVFVKNLGANQSKDVKVPDSKNSYSVNYKVSLVSADQSTLYLIAD